MKIFQPIKTRLVVWVWNHTPNCAEMSRLASKAIDQPLPWWIRLKMRLHFLICVWCQRYYKHLKFLHRAAPHFDNQTATHRGLSAEARRRMIGRLHESCGD